MLDIPQGTVAYLESLSYIQCWWELGIVKSQDFREKERQGYIMYRGELPQFLPGVRTIIANSEVLSDEDIDFALAALDCKG